MATWHNGIWSKSFFNTFSCIHIHFKGQCRNDGNIWKWNVIYNISEKTNIFLKIFSFKSITKCVNWYFHSYTLLHQKNFYYWDFFFNSRKMYKIRRISRVLAKMFYSEVPRFCHFNDDVKFEIMRCLEVVQ